MPRVRRDQMRLKHHLDRTARDGAELLVKFAQMPVRAARRIGMGPFGQFGMQKVFLQRPPRPRDGSLQVNDNLIQIDHARRDQWAQGILPGRRVATRARHQPRGAGSGHGRTRSSHKPQSACWASAAWGVAIPGLVRGRVAADRKSADRSTILQPVSGRSADHLLAGGMCGRAQKHKINACEKSISAILHSTRQIGRWRRCGNTCAIVASRLCEFGGQGHDRRDWGDRRSAASSSAPV